MLMYESCIHGYFHLSRTHIPPNLFIFDLSHFSHCSTREVYDIVVICISLVTNDVHILIIYLLAICLSPFVCLLSIGLGYLSPHWIVKFLKYFKYIFAIIFFQSMTWPFLLTVSLEELKFLTLMKFYLSFFLMANSFSPLLFPFYKSLPSLGFFLCFHLKVL